MAVNPSHITEGSILATLAGFLTKMGWKSLQKDRKLLKDIHEELTTQRTNCLTTLQEQGERTIALLEKINDNTAEMKGALNAKR